MSWSEKLPQTSGRLYCSCCLSSRFVLTYFTAFGPFRLISPEVVKAGLGNCYVN